MSIPIVQTMLAIYCLSNVMNVKIRWKTVVLISVLKITQMPRLLQKELRKGQKNSNDIFKKVEQIT